MGELFTKQRIKALGVWLRFLNKFIEHVAERVEKEKTESALQLSESFGQILHKFWYFLFVNSHPFLEYFDHFCFNL